MTNEKPKFNYGGQAVIEGVMMRGAQIAAVAVRAPDQSIVIHEERLNATLYQGRISKIPFVRGLVGLWDALVLGTRALIWSADIALIEEEEETQAAPLEADPGQAEETKSGWLSRLPFFSKVLFIQKLLALSLAAFVQAAPPEPRGDMSGSDQQRESAFSEIAVVGLVLVSLTMGIGLFFALPTALATGAAEVLGIESKIIIEIIEGIIKLTIFIGYIAAIGLMPDVRRLFGYHGAEHKTINAYEAGAELTPQTVQDYSIEHPRCGTAFLLNVVVLSILVYTLIGRPDNIAILILSRVAVIPVIAGLAYELIRFTARHQNNPIIKVMIVPNLALQRLTTRQPDDTMVEVGIAALERVLAAEAAYARGESVVPQHEIVIQPTPATD
ncbi:MAG: DUF1385 domain-containing protein [Chloroflexi bacterium]|nr:DUF1385 domain-containing protein [Chloroflexota bacterium]